MAIAGYSCNGRQTTIVYDAQRPVRTARSPRAVLETVGKMVVRCIRASAAHINKTQPLGRLEPERQALVPPGAMDSDDYWAHPGRRYGIDPGKQLGEAARPAPALIFLGEFDNTVE